MKYLGITEADIANGSGVRVTIWVSGCDVRCEGCHNPESWDYDCGVEFDDETIRRLIMLLKRKWVSGITITGGNPLAYNNLPDVYNLCKAVREQCPDKDIWLYTGYELGVNDFDNSVDIGWDNALLSNHILAMCDVVVDGKYIADLRDVSLKFRGSSNQRLIDVKKTIASNTIVVKED